jgi:hypothetical protein
MLDWILAWILDWIIDWMLDSVFTASKTEVSEAAGILTPFGYIMFRNIFFIRCVRRMIFIAIFSSLIFIFLSTFLVTGDDITDDFAGNITVLFI